MLYILIGFKSFLDAQVLLCCYHKSWLFAVIKENNFFCSPNATRSLIISQLWDVEKKKRCLYFDENQYSVSVLTIKSSRIKLGVVANAHNLKLK